MKGDELGEIYREVFGGEPSHRSWAPGRVNLIGEHTDYNGGYVLPLAVNRGVGFAGVPRQDGIVRLYSKADGQLVEFSLDDLVFDKKNPWANYFKGVAERLQKREARLKGCQAVIAGDLPMGAGLSSSAALEIASAVFLQKISGFKIDDLEMARVAQEAENQFVGVRCGIMDPFASYLGRSGQALLLDCRSLEYREVPLEGPWKIVVCDTGVKRALAGSAYNERRGECEEGVRVFSKIRPGIKDLRDISEADLNEHGNRLDPIVLKRVRHVVGENQRVLDAVGALEKNDFGKVGKLMFESHESLRNDYQVSCLELDQLVEIAKKVPGVAGGRMMGAGFGGCTVNLVEEAVVENFRREIEKGFQKAMGSKAQTYVFAPSDGAKYIW